MCFHHGYVKLRIPSVYLILTLMTFGNLSTGNTTIGSNSCLGYAACYKAKDG